VALSRLTGDVVGDSFTLNTRIVFGHGCDHSCYVTIEPSRKYQYVDDINTLGSDNGTMA